MTLDELRNEGWWADTPNGKADYVVPFSEVELYLKHIEEKHAEEKSDISQIAYSEGLQDGASQ